MRARASGTVTVAAFFCTALVTVMALGVSATGCGASRPAGRAAAAGGPTVVLPARVRSNILRADYAGSARCASLPRRDHRGVAGLADAPHDAACRRRRDVRAPFDGTTFRFKDDSARLTEKGGARFVAADVGEPRRSRSIA